MEAPLKRKVTSKLTYNASNDPSASSSSNSRSRPCSPLKTLSTSPSLTTLRPKAKVNSSATSRATTKPARPLSTVQNSPASSVNGSSIPRPTSPSKPRPNISTQVAVPRIRAARSNLSTRSTPGTPVVTHHHTDPISPDEPRSRSGSTVGRSPITGSPRIPDRDALLFHEASPSDLSRDSPPPAMKIKSKVSRVARPGTAGSETLSPPLGPLYPSSKPGTPRVRAPSVTSSLSLNSSNTPAPAKADFNFYPITTATPAANPHRFASTRASPPPPTHHHYQPFASGSPTARDDLNVTHNGRKPHQLPNLANTKIDPTTVPLPPQSPSTSAVSLSSRSSVSRSSVSYDSQSSISVSTQNTHHRTGSKDLKSAIDALVHVNGINLEEEDALGLGLGLRRSSGSGGGDTDEEASAERKVRAQAKSNRKIEDLEISNRSLLAINSMLESTRNRQAKEIRDLRRKLRESRLILPPRAYRAVKSDKENIGDDEDEEEDNNDDEDDDNNGNGPGDADDSFLRLRMLVDDMIETGKKALASTPDDFMKSGKGGAKVLTEEEVKNWRDSSSGGQDDNESKPTSRRDVSPSRIAIPDNDDDGISITTSEDEVAAMTIPHDSSASPSPPPILITSA